MSFVVVPPVLRTAHAVTVAMTRRSSSEFTKLLVVLSSETLSALGWSLGERVSVARGVGEDDGKLRLVKAPEGHLLSKASGTARAARIWLSPWTGLDTAKRKSEPVKHQIAAGALILTLPKWAETKLYRDDPRAVAQAPFDTRKAAW